MAKKTQDSGEIVVTEVCEGFVELFLVGKSPIIINRLAEKAKHELLLPKGRKTAADKANSLKHNPIEEFRASAYIIKEASAPTLLAIPASAPKRALATAALDIPGAKKAQIGRLTYVQGELLGVYGAPKMLMSITRSADMNHTPDVRTRCIVPEWAVRLTVAFVEPTINPTTIINLLSAAGLYVGIGDWRPEKGAGNYGQFTVLPTSKASEIQHILNAGREVQLAAMENPIPYNDETAELLAWFDGEIKQRGTKTRAVVKK